MLERMRTDMAHRRHKRRLASPLARVSNASGELQEIEHVIVPEKLS